MPVSKKKFDDNPIWTKEDFARSMRFSELPESLQAKLSRGTRGPQKAPKKVPVSIRLSKDVADDLRAMGDGWQTRAVKRFAPGLSVSRRPPKPQPANVQRNVG